VSPGVGFGPDGDGFVRFALIENEHRIGQAVRQIRRGLGELTPADQPAGAEMAGADMAGAEMAGAE
jgi:hypothetical protein